MKFFFTLLPLLVNFVAFSQWSTDSNTNNAICVKTGNQHKNKLISDSSGGTIIAWVDQSDLTLYAQRINSNGIIQWTANGIQVNPAPTSNSNIAVKMISDGSGGAIIIFQAFHVLIPWDSYIIAQRIDSNGVKQWGTNGVLVAELLQTTVLEIAIDGSGGAFISWLDYANDLRVQRINETGIVQWVAAGVLVGNSPINQGSNILTADGSGGALIAWVDNRTATPQIYAQRVNGSGIIQWLTNGVTVTTSGNVPQYLQLINVAGGAIICWQRNNPADIYAQKINSSGVAQWPPSGAVICTAPDAQRFSQLVSDGFGGAIITWEDERTGGFQGPPDIYAQRINSTGTIQWPVNGVPISQSAYYKYNPQIAEDGNGGATMVWADGRPPGGSGTYNIFAQRITTSGTVLWAINGVAVCTAAQSQDLPFIINDGYGGTIITWRDGRIPGNGNDIYAQRVNSNGTLGGGPLPVTLLNFQAQKINSKIELHWQTSSEQNSDYFNIERSADGRQFIFIGSVTAAGNSQTLKNYYFTDNTPSTGINFYRLRQADIDGKFTYSPILRVTMNGSEFVLSISPNPAKDVINIVYNGKKQTAIISIYDAQGRLVQKQTRRSELPITVDVKSLEPGVYFIQLSDGETVQRTRFVKQ